MCVGTGKLGVEWNEDRGESQFWNSLCVPVEGWGVDVSGIREVWDVIALARVCSHHNIRAQLLKVQEKHITLLPPIFFSTTQALPIAARSPHFFQLISLSLSFLLPPGVPGVDMDESTTWLSSLVISRLILDCPLEGLISRPAAMRWDITSIAKSASVGTSLKAGGNLNEGVRLYSYGAEQWGSTWPCLPTVVLRE